MKKIAVILITAVITASMCLSSAFAVNDNAIYDNTSTGPMVVRIQMRLRELGYLNFKPTGTYRSMTVAAAKAFQVNYRENGGYDMMVDGKIGPQSLELLFRFDAKRVSLSGISIPSGPRGSGDIMLSGDPVSWGDVKDLLVAGCSYKATDCYTGRSFMLVFSGGEHHAEMEPADAESASVFNYICGAEYNYLKRPIVIEIGDSRVAASVQCYPHGSDTVDGNDIEGHVCVFFEGSSSHVGNMPDVEHNENIKIASGQ